jgi:hypothetical protein
MARPLPFTQASVRRAMAAARKEGLTVIGIRASDGMVFVHNGDNPLASHPELARALDPPSKWEDVEV